MQPIRQSLQPEGGQPFGKYTLQRLLARGGMAEIYLARQAGPEGFDRKVVIKRILPSLSEDPSFVEMFLDEARLASQLSHPHIAHIYEFGKVGADYYLAMEYVPGVTLSQLVRGSKTGLPVEHAVKIATFLCDGLHFAHNLKDDSGRPYGIVHRDVSPQNVIVAESGGVKLLDFGIAHAVDQVHTTQQGVVKGKVSYMSPEQCRGRPLDGRSDIFSLATLLWESLTAERLFTRGTSFETMEAITRAEVPPLATYRGDIPDGLDDVLAHAFAKKPDDRYANAALVQIELEKYLSRHQLLSSPPLIAAYVRSVLGESPPAPAIGEDEPAPGDTTPAKRLPRTRPGKTERSGFVVRQPDGDSDPGEPIELDALETVVATPREGTPMRTGRSVPIVIDPLASGDGPTMHSISVTDLPAAPPSPVPAPADLPDAPALYTFSAIPSPAPSPDRYAETVRRPPPHAATQRVRKKSRTPWLLFAAFVLVGAASTAVVTIYQQQQQQGRRGTTPDLPTPDPGTPPIVATPTLELRSTPPGATVRIDGIVTSQTPAMIPIGIGTHRVTFESPGLRPEDREIRVDGTQRTIEVSVEMRPPDPIAQVQGTPDGGPQTPEPGPGQHPNNTGEQNPDRNPPRERGNGLLSVDTNPWSKVFANGRSLGETPVLTTRLTAGRHTLTFLVEGRRRVTRVVTIRDGQHTKVSFRLGE